MKMLVLLYKLLYISSFVWIFIYDTQVTLLSVIFVFMFIYVCVKISVDIGMGISMGPNCKTTITE